MHSSVITFVLINILLGGLLAKLIGVLSTLQYLNLILMISYPYGARMLVLIEYCVEAGEFDLFNGPLIYEELFTFKETTALNEMFELFGIDSMNTLKNSQSLFIIICIVILFGLSFMLVYQLAKMNYKIQCCRKIGIYAQENDNLWTNINLFIAVNYLDLASATSLMCNAMFSQRFSSHFSEWFDKQDDVFCSVLTLCTLLFLLSFPF